MLLTVLGFAPKLIFAYLPDKLIKTVSPTPSFLSILTLCKTISEYSTISNAFVLSFWFPLLSTAKTVTVLSSILFIDFDMSDVE